MSNLYGSGIQSYGTYSDPFNLPGTAVSPLSDNMTSWAARAHRQSQIAQMLAELWLYRYDSIGSGSGSWMLSPVQPLLELGTHITLTQAYRKPSTCGFSLRDPQGWLSPTNQESPWNYNSAAQFDPLLDEARKFLMRVGVLAYANLAAAIAPTSSLGVTAGVIATLTDSSFVDWMNSPAAATYAAWFAASATPVTISVDLGSISQVMHAGIRFGTLDVAGGWSLPASVQVRTSLDNATWKTFPLRPVGGDGTQSGTPGDWDDGLLLPGTATVDNLLSDPGFETGFSAGFGTLPSAPWVDNSSSSFLCSATTNDIVNAGLNAVSLDTPGISQKVNLSPLGPLAATVWACEEANSTFAGELQLKIDLLSASNTVLHTLTSPVYPLTNDGQFRQFTLNWANPPVDASVTQARVTLWSPSWTNKKPIIDDVALYLLSSMKIPAVLETGVTEIDLCDLDAPARYVQFIVTPISGTTWAVDELAIWGGGQSDFIGRNMITGYLGDQIEITAEGVIGVTGTDALKRLADNNETGLTSRYGFIDLADIAYELLTSPNDWPGAAGTYQAPWTAAELAWTAGVGLTAFIMPLWQGQSNNHLAYQYELWNEIGWVLYSDGNGVLTPFEPPYQQLRPDRVMIADVDGNQDVRFTRRNISGKDLRNKVVIRTGRPQVGAQGSATSLIPASIQRYGSRRNTITDPIAVTPDIRLKLGSQILRDYGWNLNTLPCEICPDFDTRIRDIHAFRASLRPQIFARASAVLGVRRAQELWSLQSLTHHIAAGKWWGDAEYIPYVPQSLDPPTVTQISSSGTTPYLFTLAWQTYSNPVLAGFNTYLSSSGQNGPFVLTNTGGLIGSGATSEVLTPSPVATFDQQYWAYVTAVDVNGRESEPSQVLPVLAGGSTTTAGQWAISDLTVAYDQAQGPDALGYTTYQVDLAFTSPPIPAPSPDTGAGGISSLSVYVGFGPLPASPLLLPLSQYWQRPYPNGWSGSRVPPGEVGTGQNPFQSPFTPGQLSMQIRFKPASGSSPVTLTSGTRIYVLVMNNTRIGGVASNLAYTTVP